MMTYKEALFFIGKCLTISHETRNLEEVAYSIKNNEVDWDKMVQVSTSHFVFPALYCNLDRADLLAFLPVELVNYMKHITALNKERNLLLIAQVREINHLLQANNITPVFLKGAAFLLDGLYIDIAERMVGDIDFLVSQSDFKKTIEVLTKDGYKRNENDIIDRTALNRHYNRITKDNRIGAVEIHYRMVLEPYENNFNYEYIKKTTKIIDNSIVVLSDNNNVLMTSFNKQMNDIGERIKSFSLRSSYDLFLLSQRVSTLRALENFGYYFKPLNNFLSSSFFVLNAPKSIDFELNKTEKKFVNKQLQFLENPEENKINTKKWDTYFLYKNRVISILKSIYNKESRKFLIDRITAFFKSKPTP